jgi:hypothetical protein
LRSLVPQPLAPQSPGGLSSLHQYRHRGSVREQPPPGARHQALETGDACAPSGAPPFGPPATAGSNSVETFH